MMNKKASGTMTTAVITTLLVMALFFGMFEYVDSNYDNSDIIIPLNYSDSYDDLETARVELDGDIGEVKDSVQGITEADGNLVSVAWNGLTGLASTIRLFVGIVDVGISTFNAIVPGLSFLPSWAKLLIEMAIIISIILLVLGAFKGETKA